MDMSAGLRLTGLDDFITPSQACIKPVESVEPAAGRAAAELLLLAKATPSQFSSKRTGRTKRSEMMDQRSNLHQPRSRSTTVLHAGAVARSMTASCAGTEVLDSQAKLVDFGCITSAESVLITQQSVDEFLSVLSDSIAPTNKPKPATSPTPSSPSATQQCVSLQKSLQLLSCSTQVLAANQPVEQGGKVFVVSVSPQAWASVATKYNIPGGEEPHSPTHVTIVSRHPQRQSEPSAPTSADPTQSLVKRAAQTSSSRSSRVNSSLRAAQGWRLWVE
eukprot:2437001-Rhodomonas_salina.1